MSTKLLHLVASMVLFFSCTEKHEKSHDKISTLHLKELAEDIRIPKELLKIVEDEVKSENKTASLMYTFLPLTVEFNNKSPDVIKSNPLQIVLPKGGGSIDLKSIVVGSGSFYISFPEEQFVGQPELTHLYFISQASSQKIDEETYGLGCNKWIDLKSSFKKLQKNTFLKANTTDLRYLYVLAGSYIFIFRQNNQIFLTQLTLTDSRYSDKLCSTVK